MHCGTKGGLERKTTHWGSSSLMPVTGLSFFPLRVYSGLTPPKILGGKVRVWSSACVLCTAVSSVPCRWGFALPLEGLSPVHHTDSPHGGGTPGDPAAPGSTWEGVSSINMKLFRAIKGSERLILFLNEIEQNREILFLNPSLDIAAQSSGPWSQRAWSWHLMFSAALLLPAEMWWLSIFWQPQSRTQ